MNKDIIYIDVEDDITNIVSKIKASKARIIALVPPKRIGILQSAVNMRLLNRAAEHAEKRIVLITSDQALSSLAAAARIPVAKTLQSKPEVAEIPAIGIDDGDDVIDGSELPVGILADKATPAASSKVDDAVDKAIAEDTKTSEADSLAKKSSKKVPKVPNFNLLRKKIVLIGGGIALFIIFMVWAIWFAPRATVVITAKTTTTTVDKNVTLSVERETNADEAVIKSLRQEQKKELAVDFSPTGKKKVGSKAKGRVTFSTNSISMLDKSIPAGTTLTIEGVKFTTDSSVTFTRSNNNDATVGITAADIGDEYNSVSGRASGVPSEVSATVRSETSGGSSREVTVVSSDDIAKAKAKLDEQKDSSLQSAVKSQVPSSSIVIDESYQEVRSDPTPSVGIDQEASGAVQLKTTVTASIQSIDRSDLKKFLEGNIKKEIGDKKHQKIYSDGSDDIKFAQFTERDGAGTVRLTANAKVGPEINESKVKEQAKGRNYGDIQSSLESIEGVQDVDTKFWPFWVRTVPNDDKRIKIEFKLDNGQ